MREAALPHAELPQPLRPNVHRSVRIKVHNLDLMPVCPEGLGPSRCLRPAGMPRAVCSVFSAWPGPLPLG